MMNKAIATAALVLGSTIASGTFAAGTFALADAPTVEAPTALRVCADSNGSKPGGTVYLSYTTSYRCDVVPPQRLTITNVPSKAACDGMGGRWAPANRSCWDVDY